jgi:hypothetical protein
LSMEFLQSFGNNGTIITYAIIGGIVLLTVFCFVVWVRISDLRGIFRQKKVFIEVTPPMEVSKSPQATEQFFHNLHSVGSTQRFRHRVLRRSIVFGLEVISSRNDGVRFVINVAEREAETVERLISSYLSNTKIKRIDDPLAPKNNYTKVKEFKQTKHFALPIRTYDTFEQHDPIAFITGSMNRLAEHEQVSIQLIVSPARVRNMGVIVQRYREFYKVSEATHNKAYGQLFKTELRARVVTDSQKELSNRMNGIDSAISSYNIPKVQTLKARYNFPEFIRGRRREWMFKNRMPAFIKRNSNVFSSFELANIFHFPTDSSNSEDMEVTLSRTLPAPLSLKRRPEFSVVLGETNHNGERYNIGLTEAERSRHALYIGKTGSGKTTMLEYEILQDIQNGRGVIFIDPHGDAAQSVISKIPKGRIKDVVYFNPADIDFPVGINMLELPEGITGNELLLYKDKITDSLVTVFRKVFSDGETGGSRNEAALQNTILTALTLENPTIFTLNKIINDPKFRKEVVAGLEDETLRDYWLNEVGEAGGMQRVKMFQGLTTKLGKFQTSAFANRTLNQPKSTIDFDDILNSGKILICNLSKGKIGEETAEFFGVIIMAKLQIAALKRADLPEKERTPVYIYVDEFQNFATPSFVELLAEARKYGISLNMAQQTLSQQKNKEIINTMVTNSGTIVTFQTVSLDDERYIGHLFTPFIETREIFNLPAYNFYARISSMTSQKPVSGVTIVPDVAVDDKIAKAVRDSSRKLYTRPYVPETPRKAVSGSKSTNVESKPSKKKKPPTTHVEPEETSFSKEDY